MGEQEQYERQAPPPPQRVTGTPLPVGGGAHPPFGGSDENRNRYVPAPPGRSLETGAAASPGDGAMNLLRTALPFVQRFLPLLEGTLGAAVSSMLSVQQKPTAQPPAPPEPPPPAPVIQVDLEPIENGLSDLRSQHRELRGQFIEQNASLKRVEDQLEMVREATDRNTLEQQELMEDLKTVGTRINLFVVAAMLLLAGSIVLNIVLYLHLKRVLP